MGPGSQPFGRHHDGHVLSDRVSGCVAINPLRATIPGENQPRSRVAEDGTLGTFHNCGQESLRFPSRPPLGDIPFDRDETDNFAALILYRRDLHLLLINSSVFATV